METWKIWNFKDKLMISFLADSDFRSFSLEFYLGGRGGGAGWPKGGKGQGEVRWVCQGGGDHHLLVCQGGGDRHLLVCQEEGGRLGTETGRGRTQDEGMLGEGLEVEKDWITLPFCIALYFNKDLVRHSGQTLWNLERREVIPGKEGGGPEGGEDFFGRGSERRGSGPE